MDSSLWKINSTEVSSFAQGVNLALFNQAQDRLTFNADGQPFDSAALFDYGDALSLYKGTVRVFAGVVLSGPRFGSQDSERHDYEAAGLWWYLEQLVFEQAWRSGTGTLNKSHVILGRDIDDDPVSIGAVITEVLDYAIGKGAPFTYAQADLDLLTAVPPADEQTDVACSEAVAKMLRWMPDTVTWFDYSAATPVLHFTRRANAVAVQYDCTAGDPVESIDIRRRDDLVQAGVIIKYERVDNIDGEAIPTLSEDVYPAGTVAGFSTASFTINVAGMQLTTQSVEVEVETIATTTLLEELNPNITAAGGSVHGTVGSVTILRSGSLPAWTGKSVSNNEIFALATYDEAGAKHVDEPVSAVVPITNAESKTYTREVSYTPADPIPVGLAQALYEALVVPHFQGSFQTLETEVDGNVHPGMVLNLTGGVTEWATMRAVVQQVSLDLDTGRTTIAFGPPEHLSPQDHIALLNANRQRITLYSGTSRSTGSAASGGDVATGGGTANSSASGGLSLSKLVLADSGATKTITLDVATIAKGKVLVGTGDNTMAVDTLKWR